MVLSSANRILRELYEDIQYERMTRCLPMLTAAWGRYAATRPDLRPGEWKPYNAKA
jgi:hypothetical protein